MLGLRRYFANSFTAGFYSSMGPGKKQSEDAYLITSDMLSVADGVGGWISYGVDPSKYAWELMKNIADTEKALKSERLSTKILTQAANDCKIRGSSTCSLILLHPTLGSLDTLNIGDSGFFIYRKTGKAYKLIEKSKETLHGFNHPYQLGTNGDKVESAWTKIIEIKDKDVVIMYSDGLTDNLYEDTIMEIINKECAEKVNVENTAKALGEKAYEMCQDTKYISPFAKAYMEGYKGGKPDDITVVVALINLEKEA
ncbi:hypothetical protein SteCoe_21149 [Stentor coeruleus]|uniref:Protein phosphatase n=1 Tax=Stentor coeruleus TaxID=5963 RepID=A0A1R2BQ22_9CILI|nr:hypothetical protein SteCoe_21149 [Stentor coeruleus]